MGARPALAHALDRGDGSGLVEHDLIQDELVGCLYLHSERIEYLAGKVALGRSFGLMPANRGIVSSGIYRVVRHPIYAGYLVTHAAFLAAHPAPLNLLLLVVSDVCLLVRAAFEERTLTLDPAYRSYMGEVRWRVVPGLF